MSAASSLPRHAHADPATPAITRFAGRAGDHNDRAMVGSRLLAAALGARYGLAPAAVGVPRTALSASWDTELDAAREELGELAAHYDDLLAAGRRPITALSRCAVALATLPVVAAHHPDAVVVWFDAHADLHTPRTTTTGYLGGLALSGPLGLWDSGLGAGLAMHQAVLVGARDIDPPEQALIDATDITLVAPGRGLARRLEQVVAGRPVYVHVDCDVLEPGTVPTDYIVPDGLDLGDLHDAARVLARSRVVGVEIGELESVTGEEDLTGLLDALSPLLDAVALPRSG